MSRSTLLPSLALSLLLCLGVEASAQSQTTGRIEGTVSDQSGAVIVQAEVTATSVADSRRAQNEDEPWRCFIGADADESSVVFFE
jgi:hypothetical protein